MKVREATDGRLQLTSNGFGAYSDAVEYCIGMRVDYAKLIKVYGTPRDGEQRDSTAEVISAEVVPFSGNPEPAKICASHVERQNPTLCILLITTSAAVIRRSHDPGNGSGHYRSRVERAGSLEAA
jgi:hypothetical protein